MSSAVSSSSFLDTIAARILAAVIAVLLGFAIYTNYGDSIKQELAGERDTLSISTYSSQRTEPEVQSNPGLEACLAERIGHVNKMREDGILSEAKYGAFKARAEELCVQQNPG